MIRATSHSTRFSLALLALFLTLLLPLTSVFAATITPTTFQYDHPRDFTLSSSLPAGSQTFMLYNQTSHGDSYWSVAFTCNGTQCTGNLPVDTAVLLPSQGCIAPKSEYDHVYNPPLDGIYGADSDILNHPWYHNVCTPFEIEALDVHDPTPSEVTAGSWLSLQFASNAGGSVPLKVTYDDWGQTISNTSDQLTATCDTDSTQTTHTCTLASSSVYVPDTAVAGSTLKITPNVDLATGELDLLVHGNSSMSYPWTFSWGPIHPTKVSRADGIQADVQTDSYVQVDSLPAQVLFADTSGTYLSGYDQGGLCQDAQGDAPPYCQVWVHDVPANAAWGCIRRMAPGEQIANVDPAFPPTWITDTTNCSRFTVVDYALPKLNSMTPTLVATGTDGFVLTITGEWNDDVKTWNLIDIDNWTWFSDIPDFVSLTPTQMKIRVPASLVGDVGTTHTVTLWTLYSNNPTDTYEIVAQAATATISAGDLTQSGNSVVAPVSWSAGAANVTIDCGTVPAQTSTDLSVNCVYATPGTFTVTGTYGAGQSADPIQVVVSAQTLSVEGLSAQVAGSTVTSFTTYSDAVPVDLAAAFSLSSGIGIPDALDPDASSVTITRAEGGSTSGTFTTRDGLTWGGRVHLGPGTYSLDLTGQSVLGQALSASTTLTITQATAQLSTASLSQAGASVQLPVSWPADSSLSAQVVDCGTTGTQSFSGTSGTCTYSQAGTYTVQGRFTDSLGTTGIRTAPVSVLVPAVPPGPAVLRAAPASGQTPTHNLSGSVPVATYGAPTVYPVPTAFTLAFDPPSSDSVGIADPLDVIHSKLYVKPIASAADLTAPVDSHDQILSLQDTGDGSYRAALALSSFVPTSGDPTTWQQRVLLQGQTLTGTPVSATLQLQGPRADAAQIQYTGQRINPIYPYAPATVRYVTTNLHSAISGEPITQAWTTSDGQGRAVVGDGPVDLTFPTAGTKTVTLTAGGPLTQAKVATDTVVVPTVPAAAIAFTTTVPTKNRPPAAYRFAPNYPPLQPGEHLVGNPTWSVNDHSTPATLLGQFTGTPFYFTFTAPSTYDVIVSQPTSLRTLYGRTTVTVLPDQPPTATLDCSSSYISKTTNPWQYVLSCKAVNAVDPDGTIKSYTWAMPDLQYSVAGTATWHTSFTVPQAVTVTLTLRDDSYATCAPCGQTVLQTTFDLRTLH